MDLGQRIRQVRLEKGLSQRQLCGDTITRNMLSLIESGSAHPSMDTLRFLAARLEKPVSFFLEEDTASPNQARILQARSAPPEEALAILREYQEPDPVFDPEYRLLTALSAMALAEKAIAEDRKLLAAQLLEQAARAGEDCIYYTSQLEQRRLLLCYAAGAIAAPQLAQQLPELTSQLQLLAQAALDTRDYDRCGALLAACTRQDAHWHFLQGELHWQTRAYAEAAAHYRLAEATMPRQVYPRLESCYRELGDYKNAYEYACKQR